MTAMKLELTLFGRPVTEDDNGFICLNDLWTAAGGPKNLRPAHWRQSKKSAALAAALTLEIVRNSYNSGDAPIKPVAYSTGRGRAARTYAHAILALDYTEWLSPELGVEMRRVFLRYRANDLTLVDEMMDRIKTQLMDDAERVEIREEFSRQYRRFRGQAQQAGCREGRDYAFVGGGGYGGFYGGLSTEEVRIIKELPENAALPDFMGNKEGSANKFRMMMTVTAFQNNRPHSVDAAFDLALEVGESVRDLLLKWGGPAPERLPASDHVREARKRLKALGPLLENDPDYGMIAPDKYIPGPKNKPV